MGGAEGASPSPHGRRFLSGSARPAPTLVGDVLGSYGSLLFGLLAVGAVLSPLLFTRRGFGLDFMNSLWLVSVQAHSVAHAGWFPSYFTNTTATAGSVPTYALFEPNFAFDGGSLYALAGWISWLDGENAVFGFEIVTLAAVGGAYGGLYFLGRLLGVPRSLAHLGPLVFVSAAYFASDLYARGDWSEFVAFSALVPAGVAAYATTRGERFSPGAWLACLAATFLLAGSDPLIAQFALAAALVLAAFAAIAARGRRIRARWILRPLSAMALGLGLNGWFLVPFLAYGANTQVATNQPVSAQFFSSFANMLDPLRRVPSASGTPGLFTQLPVLAFAWGLGAALFVLLRRSSTVLGRRLVLVLVVWSGLLVAFASDYGLWQFLPRTVAELQFPYRLAGYADAGVAVLVVGALAVVTQSARTGSRRGAQFAIGSLVVIAALGVAQQIWQVWVPEVQVHTGNLTLNVLDANRTTGLDVVDALPASWYAGNSFGDATLASVAVPANRHLDFAASSLNAGGTGLSARVDPPPGDAPTLTNLAAGPYLISVRGGLRVVGQEGGFLVVERHGRRSGALEVEVTTADSAGVVVGRSASLASLVALLLVLAAWGLRALGRRRATSDPVGELDVAPLRTGAADAERLG